MMALVAAGTLNSSAAYLRTAVKGASSGTLNLQKKNGGKWKTSFRVRVSRQKPKKKPRAGCEGCEGWGEGGEGKERRAKTSAHRRRERALTHGREAWGPR